MHASGGLPSPPVLIYLLGEPYAQQASQQEQHSLSQISRKQAVPLNTTQAASAHQFPKTHTPPGWRGCAAPTLLGTPGGNGGQCLTPLRSL
eukprot:1152912-Pelagomonas_calceolata.AAC.1